MERKTLKSPPLNTTACTSCSALWSSAFCDVGSCMVSSVWSCTAVINCCRLATAFPQASDGSRSLLLLSHGSRWKWGCVVKVSDCKVMVQLITQMVRTLAQSVAVGVRVFTSCSLVGVTKCSVGCLSVERHFIIVSKKDRHIVTTHQ